MENILTNKQILYSLSSTDFILLVMFLVIIIERVKNKFSKNFFTHSLFYIVGTFLHELSHWITAIFTYGKPPPFFSIIPDRDDNSSGRVSVNNVRFYNAFLIGMSPLLLLFCAYFISKYFFIYFDFTILNFILYIYLIFIISSSSIPSIVDFKIAFGNPLRIIIGTFELLIIYFIFQYSSHFYSSFVSLFD